MATVTPAPVTLEPIGQVGAGSKAVATQGHYAYINVGSRLVVLDIADLTHPTAVGQSPPLPSFESVAVVESHAYIAGEGGLHVIDVSDPTAPTKVGLYATTETGWSATVLDTTAYLVYGSQKKGGLRILDISDPGNPTEISDYQDYISLVSDVAVVGSPSEGSESVYAYLATGANYGLVVLDVSDPAQPVSLGTQIPGMILGIAVTGNTIFVTDALGCLHIADISDPADIFEIGFFEP